MFVCVISEELRQFTGFCAACCMALSHIHWQHSSTCYEHAPLILNNGSENSGEISCTCFSQIGVNTTWSKVVWISSIMAEDPWLLLQSPFPYFPNNSCLRTSDFYIGGDFCSLQMKTQKRRRLVWHSQTAQMSTFTYCICDMQNSDSISNI